MGEDVDAPPDAPPDDASKRPPADDNTDTADHAGAQSTQSAAKRQRLQALFIKVPELETSVAMTLANINVHEKGQSYNDDHFDITTKRLQHAIQQLNMVKTNVDVKRIIDQLDREPKLNRKIKQLQRPDARHDGNDDVAEIYSPPGSQQWPNG